jgi:hypothetical protein
LVLVLETKSESKNLPVLVISKIWNEGTFGIHERTVKEPVVFWPVI